MQYNCTTGLDTADTAASTAATQTTHLGGGREASADYTLKLTAANTLQKQGGTSSKDQQISVNEGSHTSGTRLWRVFSRVCTKKKRTTI